MQRLVDRRPWPANLRDHLLVVPTTPDEGATKAAGNRGSEEPFDIPAKWRIRFSLTYSSDWSTIEETSWGAVGLTRVTTADVAERRRAVLRRKQIGSARGYAMSIAVAEKACRSSKGLWSTDLRDVGVAPGWGCPVSERAPLPEDGRWQMTDCFWALGVDIAPEAPAGVGRLLGVREPVVGVTVTVNIDGNFANVEVQEPR